MTAMVDLKSLPNLPGYSFQDLKDHYPRPQTWNTVNGTRIEQKEGLSHDRPKLVKVPKPQETWRSGSLPDSQSRANFKNAGNGIEHDQLPSWDAFDRHVLRFYGYFKEAVVETNLENHRVRNVIIYYYLEDDTSQIIEKKQDNSGIPQGQLIRRHRFPAASPGGYLKLQDLQVGSILQLYGRSIMVTDCDPFTREYFEQTGMSQGPAEPMETDPWQETRKVMKQNHAAQPRTYEKVYREVMLGGGHINADMQQFLEKDKKVLRFYCINDDVRTPQFERRPFTIMFFLADDQLEIREQYPLNCGRDNFPIFFRKGKMPIGAFKVEGPQAQPKKKHEYVHGNDFRVNMNVTLLGENFFIYDADEFTRKYFGEELGEELESRVDVQLPERAVPRAKTPPYTGYGTWDDSMGSVTHLIPKPPKKDFIKLFRHEGKVLRFKAKFANAKPEDMDRIFVMSYYLQDDTFSIHEPPQRNLGIVTGRFLEKGVHMNQLTGQLFQPNDLLPGNSVKVYNSEFIILDMDEYSKKVFENPDTLMKTFDLEKVVQNLRESMRQQYPLVRDIFRRFDSDHDGVMTIAEFQQALEKFGFQLPPEDVVKIMKHFDPHHDGQVGYNEFCNALMDADYTTVMMATKPPLKNNHDQNYAEQAVLKSAERAETVQVRKATKELGDVIYKKQNFVMRILKEMKHITHEDCVTCEQIQSALEQVGHPFHIEDVQRAILYTLPGANLDAIDYRKLFQAVVTSFHDLSGGR